MAWRCKECGCEVTGLGGITYETCGLLDKKGNIQKHEILEEIDSDTDFYRCNSCGEESEILADIAEWEEDK